MPVYCYTVPGGATVERPFRMGQAPMTITLEDGTVAERDIAADHNARRRNAGSGWPLVCYASGVNAAQAKELRDFFRRHGEVTEVTRDGDPVYRDQHHRRRCLKIRASHDRQSYDGS